jgi:hypothetical protein
MHHSPAPPPAPTGRREAHRNYLTETAVVAMRKLVSLRRARCPSSRSAGRSPLHGGMPAAMSLYDAGVGPAHLDAHSSDAAGLYTLLTYTLTTY